MLTKYSKGKKNVPFPILQLKKLKQVEVYTKKFKLIMVEVYPKTLNKIC